MSSGAYSPKFVSSHNTISPKVGLAPLLRRREVPPEQRRRDVEGDLSSVHCDLLEGGKAERAID